MEAIGFGFSFFLLIAGIMLTFITIRHMIKGNISISLQAKILLSIGMILMQLILLLSLLPPLELNVDNPFVETNTHIVTPADPIESIEAE